MTTIKVSRAGSVASGLALDPDNARSLVRSRIVNYAGPYFVVSGPSSEESFDDASEAVVRAVELLDTLSSVSVYPASKRSAGFDLSTPKPRPVKEAIAQLSEEDELMPRDGEA